ncbi:CoA transferase [Aeromicrobium sp. YIM 150415]|uniref:CaiB/BaiF CoA transferase family protein n=1 Tax=Aeromicrobium sp. YIM 150415 TaxID=2803912 RepID=UPI001962FEC2|nr:CoA transferase [Aeromicrobium sp. YIM 150415]MBM9464683.1 CoA transferase [Aeromicrobium sp. YIM 150415]
MQGHGGEHAGMPLSGITVVDFGQYIAAPGATQTLADLGAEVIKVENPGGDQARAVGTYGHAIMRAYNRRKKSVVLNLRDEEGLAAARRLIERADVVVQNLRPGAMARLGLSNEVIRGLNPSVITAAVTGFGTDGPSRDRPGLDIAAQAESGLMSITGERDGQPQRVGVPIVDHVASIVLSQAIITALFHRERTGQGDDLSVSLLDVGVDLQRVNWGEYAITGQMPIRRGNGQPGAAPGADIFSTADGDVVVSAYTDDKFSTISRLAGRPDLPGDPRFADNPSRVAHRPELLDVLAPYFLARSTDTVVQELSDAGIVVGDVRTYDRVLSADDVVAGGVFSDCTDADGTPYRMPTLPFVSRHVSRSRDGGTVPSAGEHTRQVLDSMGSAAGSAAPA